MTTKKTTATATAKNALATATVKKSVATKTTATATATANSEKSNVIFSFRGVNSIGSTVVAKSGLKQLTNTSHDATQLILSGKSSLNLRKKTCFVNATTIDFELLKSTKKYECCENANSVDAIRPHKVYFDFNELSNVCSVLAKNKFNVNGYDIV